MLRDKAIGYLRNLHGLEIMAGLNFVAVRDDLRARGRLSAGLERRLGIAFRQEMRHAVQVRNMLAALGYRNKAELTRIMRDFEAMLLSTLEAFPAYRRAYARIVLNHVVETKLAEQGNDETLAAMMKVGSHVPYDEGSAILATSLTFHATVAREEPEHVELDRDVMAIYHELAPGLDAADIMRAIRQRSKPFYRAIRVKREFVKAAEAA